MTGRKHIPRFFAFGSLAFGLGFFFVNVASARSPLNDQGEFVPIAVHASRIANYATDVRRFELTPVDVSIIKDILQDRDLASQDLAAIVEDIQSYSPPIEEVEIDDSDEGDEDRNFHRSSNQENTNNNSNNNDDSNAGGSDNTNNSGDNNNGNGNDDKSNNGNGNDDKSNNGNGNNDPDSSPGNSGNNGNNGNGNGKKKLLIPPA